jgi:hypothetical protein
LTNGNEHHLADQEGADRCAGDRGNLDAVLQEHQGTGKNNNVEGDKEEDRRRQQLAQLVLDSLSQITHWPRS